MDRIKELLDELLIGLGYPPSTPPAATRETCLPDNDPDNDAEWRAWEDAVVADPTEPRIYEDASDVLRGVY